MQGRRTFDFDRNLQIFEFRQVCFYIRLFSQGKRTRFNRSCVRSKDRLETTAQSLILRTVTTKSNISICYMFFFPSDLFACTRVFSRSIFVNYAKYCDSNSFLDVFIRKNDRGGIKVSIKLIEILVTNLRNQRSSTPSRN